MKQYIEVLDHTPPPGQGHMRSAYPAPGAYFDTATRMIYFVGTESVYTGCLPPGFVFSGTLASGSCDAHRLLDQVIAIQNGGAK